MSAKIWLTFGASLSLLAACATHQENPNYAYSTKYKAATPSSGYATTPVSYTQSAPVSYQGGATTTYASSSSGTSSAANHNCLRKEQNRELIGAGLGGTVGAIAGNKLIGGTAGTVVGAALGGTAGYGVGGLTVDCEPQNLVAHHPQPVSTQTYTHQNQVVPQQSYAAPATYQSPTQEYYTSDDSYTAYEISQIEHQSPTDTEFASISDTGTPGYQVLQSQTVVQAAPVQSVATAQLSHGAQPVEYDYSENVIAANAGTVAEYSETRLLGGNAQQSHLVKEGDTVYSLARKNCVGVNDIQALNGLNSSFAIKIGDSLNLPNSQC